MQHASFMRIAALALLLPVLAACDDDGVSPDLLAPAEVSGIYDVCTLVFTPTGALEPVDIRSAAFELSTPSSEAELFVDPAGTFEIEYTPKGQFSDRELRGTYEPEVSTVAVSFTSSGGELSALLLPNQLDLAFQESPKVLSVSATSEYDVPRAEYARLRGISESGLAERIPGTLSARFAQGGC